jgi:hypothetical protein
MNTTDLIEAKISDVLWQWRFANHADRFSIVKESRLALLLEFWFPFEDIILLRSLGAWCDGIPMLMLEVINRTAFKMTGVGHFPHELSPFELEFHYKNRQDRLTSKIVLRFGISNHAGGLKTFACTMLPERVLASSPRDDSDWAIAVELSPQASN